MEDANQKIARLQDELGNIRQSNDKKGEIDILIAIADLSEQAGDFGMPISLFSEPMAGSRLIRHRFDDRHALVNPGTRYYLVTVLFPGLLCMVCTISLNVGDPGEAGVTNLSSLILEEQKKCLGDF